jgi:hypothetical protein
VIKMSGFEVKGKGRVPEVEGATFVGAHAGAFKKGSSVVVVGVHYDYYDRNPQVVAPGVMVVDTGGGGDGTG